MGVFRRSRHSRKTTGTKTVIANGCQLNGQVILAGDLHLDGRIDGTIEAVQLSVGKQGVLVGLIRAKHVVVAGMIEGQVICDTLELLAGCRLHGDVCCQDFIVEKGAQFIGSTKASIADAALHVLTKVPTEYVEQTSSAAVQAIEDGRKQGASPLVVEEQT